MTPKQFAETEVLGKPVEDVGARIAETWHKMVESVGIGEANLQNFVKSLGKTVTGWTTGRDRRMISPEEAAAIDYMEHKAHVQEQSRRRQEEEFAPVSIAPEAPAATTGIDPKELELEPIPLATLEPPPPGPVKQAVDLVGKGLTLTKEKGRDFVGGMIGMLIEDAPELLVGGEIIEGLGILSKFTAAGKRLGEVKELESAIKNLSKTEKILFRKQLGIKLSERLGVKAAGLAGETGVFLTPDMLEKGELPTGEEAGHMMLAVLGFRTGRKLFGKAGEAIKKRLPKEVPIPKETRPVTRKDQPATRKTIEEADALEVRVSTLIEKTKKDLNIREGLVEGKSKLKEIDSKIEALNSQIKRTPKGRVQNKLVNERKKLNEEKRNLLAQPKENLVKEVNKTIEEAKSAEELEAVMQAIKEEINKKAISRLPGEVNELNQLFTKAKKKGDLLKEVPSAKPTPAKPAVEGEGNQPKVIEGAPPTKAGVSKKPEGEAPKPKEEVGVVEKKQEKRLSFEEFEAIPEKAERKRIFERNPITKRPGTPAFERHFREASKKETKSTAAGAGDVNGFKVINDALGEGAADRNEC